MPGRWDAMHTALGLPANHPPTLDEAEFLAGMKALALGRQCDPGMIPAGLTIADALVVFQAALNNSLKNACKEIHDFVQPANETTLRFVAAQHDIWYLVGVNIASSGSLK